MTLPTERTSENARCLAIRAAFSDYLDGAVSGREMQAIAAHLETCDGCSGEFAEWRALQRNLSALGPARPPADLALRLRSAISREQATRTARWRDSASLAWDNVLRPFVLQAAGGLTCAVVLISTIVVLLGVVPPPSSVLAHDEPLGAMTTPHYLYSADMPRPIVLPSHDRSNEDESGTVVVEAMINSEGRVYDYTVIAAPDSPDAPALQSQIIGQLMLAVFRPASVFGVPVKGHVLMTFSAVSVHG